ncbi:MAG: hypothetical protein AWM53_00661 [Candidatus Dichloromethanomonas elyunquensis]|nr:MAG: hypothetical protein AWM53_00661 [Candidatus Dichloromethanomonas elyunquensis]
MKEKKQFNYAQRWRIEHSGINRSTHKRKTSIYFLTLIGVFVAALLASPWIWQFILTYQLNTIEQKIAVYHDVASTLEEVDSVKDEITKMNNFLGIAQTKSKKPWEVLTQINRLLPSGTVVTSFSLQADNSIQINVDVPGPVDLAKFWMNFRDSGLFTDFDMKTVSLTDQVQHLSLTLELKQEN